MTVFYEGGGVTVLHGDCVAELAGLPDGSVDAVVTDPPYGLEFMGKEWDSFRGDAWRNSAGMTTTGYTDGGRRLARPAFGGGDLANPTCATCGGRKRGARKCGCVAPEWRVKGKLLDQRDNNAAQMRAFQAWCETWATECLRVLKPGGHLLAFGGTRTAHRLTCAIEDAGFEIRDSIAWLYGSGFPKSLDVSKAIDKAAGVEREVIGSKLGQPGYSLTDGNGDHRTYGKGLGNTGSGQAECAVTAPATDDAHTWQGWGTALKPAHEPITVARKPLSGTVAATVLQHGTGALNIDGCRVGEGGGTRGAGPGPQGDIYGDGLNGARAETVAGLGRWPANVALDETAAAHLDQQSGDVPTQLSRTDPARSGAGGMFGLAGNGARTSPGAGDTGGASRFFYTAKAGSGERVRLPKDGAGEGRIGKTGVKRRCRLCGNQTIRPGSDPMPACGHDDAEWVPTAARPEHVAHPTVKPLALMRWLVRLVTPPGGTVLDPFAGSGTTAEAALLEGFACITVERVDEYLPLIVQRLNRRRDPEAYLRAAGVDDLGLFALDEAGPVVPPPTGDRDGEATADTLYTDRGATNFAAKPGRRRKE